MTKKEFSNKGYNKVYWSAMREYTGKQVEGVTPHGNAPYELIFNFKTGESLEVKNNVNIESLESNFIGTWL